MPDFLQNVRFSAKKGRNPPVIAHIVHLADKSHCELSALMVTKNNRGKKRQILLLNFTVLNSQAIIVDLVAVTVTEVIPHKCFSCSQFSTWLLNQKWGKLGLKRKR